VGATAHSVGFASILYSIEHRLTCTHSIEYNPDLHFVVVINPNSGPGEPPAPDARYAQELPKLNKQKNVTTVGYVRLQYCKRSLEQVYEDVAIYAGWAKNQAAGIYVEGIFLDEAPNEWSDRVGKYLDDLSVKIKETQGILGNKLVRKASSPICSKVD